MEPILMKLKAVELILLPLHCGCDNLYEIEFSSTDREQFLGDCCVAVNVPYSFSLLYKAQQVRTIPVKETIDKIIYHKELDVVVAATSRTDMVTVQDGRQERLQHAESAVTNFINAKIVPRPQIVSVFDYPKPLDNMSMTYDEELCSVIIVCGDRICLMDVLKLWRFEKITSMTTGQINNEECLLVATQTQRPGDINVQNCRILVYRFRKVYPESQPSDPSAHVAILPNRYDVCIEYLHSLSVPKGVTACIAINNHVYGFAETDLFDLEWSTTDKKLVLQERLTGDYSHVASVLQNSSNSSVASIVSSARLVQMILRHRPLTATFVVGSNTVIGIDTRNIATTISHVADHIDAAVDNANNFIDMGDFYTGDVIKAIRSGIPLLPPSAHSKGITSFRQTWSSVSGGIGVIMGIDEDVFNLLKRVQSVIDGQMNPPFGHSRFRNGVIENNVIDGDFLKRIFEFEDFDALIKNVEVPMPLLMKHPGVSAGMVAFFYMQQLWAFH